MTDRAPVLRPLLVWSVPRYLGGRYWFWKCRLCDEVEKNLIPALSQAYDAAVGHLWIHEEIDDA